MKKAILYIRVSTDEQADKGYSQRDQHERLQRYCEQNSIAVLNIIFEDHSAKTFNRPAWTRMLSELRKSKSKPDAILFTKWDRFSRNVSESYQMIGVLSKLGVQPISIEQPLDMTIPESKMMLAIYLAAGEVDNDRRALNVFYGMRRAKKEGRFMGTAPLGYKNLSSPEGKKYIAPFEPEAGIMKWVFQEISRNVFAVDQIRKKANQLGLVCTRMTFWRNVRNPVYCGKLIIKQHKDEESYIVDAQHEPLVSQALFYDVQDILNGRKRVPAAKLLSMELLPLRNFIKCNKCHKMLTGSSSKGKHKHYYYYHCDHICGVRHNAIETNKLFLDLLRTWVLNPAAVELLKLVISSVYKSRTKNEFNAKTQVMTDITKQNEKIAKARRLLLDEEIESSDYKEIKADCDAVIARLEVKLQEVSESKVIRLDIDKLTDKIISTFCNLDKVFEKATLQKQRHILCSLFPEKIEFDGEGHRTPRVNTIAKAIWLINNELGSLKTDTAPDFQTLYRGVVPTKLFYLRQLFSFQYLMWL
ncbi:DNA invertase Pin-like site-specific DNA recombinase [Mucilaginibacter gracilis]|uniref:DNA invertase Pin-like site-specific DNA recombinase n=1 Tax=Mucilaginibacter gracilis TaxID=423350 RepID=A0A495IYQ7_9SPHI|nr:recombinase family protein [Mucilaginibacter gracilis]RKR81846.1 DNA invertase Pin-like site-specific DNA recombinase [Mucilaginibacter gracilis]